MIFGEIIFGMIFGEIIFGVMCVINKKFNI